jgi:hypothetical protein
MNWLKSIFSGGLKKAAEAADILVKRWKLDPEVAHQHKREILDTLAAVINEMEESVQAELQAKERIIVAEMNQDDKFTKRARPSVVYVGLALAVFEVAARYVSLWTGSPLPSISSQVPTEFWVAWGGICGTWVIGRSAEKRGQQNRLIGLITGNGKKKRSLFE